ncbi:hypothetical protein PV433_26170 [Paenibacillus sp. GYB004]|uniref:hypothetical protein n=1 Tax=Paenibacillus sp. GYB004 TaxID=2994393 RepID=UPI002F963B0D
MQTRSKSSCLPDALPNTLSENGIPWAGMSGSAAIQSAAGGTTRFELGSGSRSFSYIRNPS